MASDRVRAVLRAFAQALIETCAPRIEVRSWPPAIRIGDGADERIAAVRAGTRKVGVDG